MIRRVMIGSPVRDAMTVPYVNGLLQVMRQPWTDVEFEVEIARSAYVGANRQALVEKAREKGCSEIVMVDVDMEWGPKELARLLSHDVEIVSALYAKRVPGEPQWTAYGETGSKPDERGLQPCTSLPGGFLRIKMEVFDRLDAKFPSRRFQNEGEKPRTEYFPVGIAEKDGWRTPAEAQNEAIRGILRTYGATGEAAEQIVRLMSQEQAPLPVTLGEDVSFSRLARAAGYTLWTDCQLCLRHWGEAAHPLKLIPV